VGILKAFHDDKPGDFNAAVSEYKRTLEAQAPSVGRRAALEATFRSAQPFLHPMVLYVGAFLLAAFSWLGFSRPLSRAALGLVIVAFAVHTIGMAVRIYLHGHPPITNLYASSLFV